MLRQIVLILSSQRPETFLSCQTHVTTVTTSDEGLSQHQPGINNVNTFFGVTISLPSPITSTGMETLPTVLLKVSTTAAITILLWSGSWTTAENWALLQLSLTQQSSELAAKTVRQERLSFQSPLVKTRSLNFFFSFSTEGTNARSDKFKALQTS